MHPAPTFAMLARGDLRLLLSVPSGQGGGGRRCPTAGAPSRAAGIASSSRSTTCTPRSTGCAPPARGFRNEIVEGMGGDQILLEDPSRQRDRALPGTADRANSSYPVYMGRPTFGAPGAYGTSACAASRIRSRPS